MIDTVRDASRSDGLTEAPSVPVMADRPEF